MATPAATVGHNREITYQDFLRTDRGTIAGEYLRSYWQPIYRGQDLAIGQAKPVRIMGEDLALYRGADGEARLVEARCAHRGAKLSVGWVDGNNIRCAYHGWTYDGVGKCVAQPAEPKPFCDQVKLRAYPTHEYLGLIFAHLGDGEPPAFERWPEFEDDEYPCELTYAIWPCNYFLQLENSMDYAHTEFLHWQFRYKSPAKVDFEETAFGMQRSTPGLSGQGGDYDRSYVHMPNAHEWMGPSPLRDFKVGQLGRSWRVPCDDGSHIRFDLRFVPIKGKMADEYKTRAAAAFKPRDPAHTAALCDAILNGHDSFARLKEHPEIAGNELVNVQDCTVMSSQEPTVGREITEMLGQTDLGIVMLRRIWKRELEAFAAGAPPRTWPRPRSLWSSL
jgi:5,5'-dehydrodivanillate O-demethylase